MIYREKKMVYTLEKIITSLLPYIAGAVYVCCVQDVGLYVCGARNEMNINGDSVDGVVYLNMDLGE